MATIEMYRGDSALLDVAVVDDIGLPYSLSGCKLWMTAKLNKHDSDLDAVFIKQSDVPGEITINTTAGTAVVELLPDDTSTLDGAVTLVYDVQMKDSADRIWTIDTGTINILEDVTRDDD